MQIKYYPSNSISDLDAALKNMSQQEGTKSLYLFVCDANGWTKQQIQPSLKALKLPIIGGIFPQLICQDSNHERGFVIAGLRSELELALIEGLSDDACDFDEKLDASIPEGAEFSSMMVFVDGLSSRIGAFIDSLFATFGSGINYIGGGAGSLSFESRPCVFTNEGVFANAAVLGLIKESVSVEAGHGWKPFDKGHVVTEVEKNIVKQIDYKNALEIYQSLIKNHLKQGDSLTEENFFTNSQSFPLGIKRATGDYIVRDPIAINQQGELICVGELANGDYIDILTAEPEDLIGSVREMAVKAARQGDAEPRGVLLIDCISRALFLKEQFSQELIAARNAFGKDVPMFGALVLGEIANSGTGYLEFYNKTSVMARF